MRNLVAGLLIAVVMYSSSDLATATAPSSEGCLSDGTRGSLLRHTRVYRELTPIRSASHVHTAAARSIELIPGVRIWWAGLRPFQIWGTGYECEFEPAIRDSSSTWTEIKDLYRREKPSG